MPDKPLGGSKLLRAARGVLSTFASLLQTRFELLLLELREVGTRALVIVLLATCAACCGAMFVITANFALLYWLWDTAWRDFAIGGTVLFHALATIGFGVAVYRMIALGPTLLEGTLSELRKDRAWLRRDG